MVNDDDEEDRDSGRDTGALRRGGAANSSKSGKDESDPLLDSLDRAALDGLVEHALREPSNMHSDAAKASLRVVMS